MRNFLILLCFAMLAACSSRFIWVHQDPTYQNFDLDVATCLERAGTTTYPTNGGRVEGDFNTCMLEHGWRLIPD